MGFVSMSTICGNNSALSNCFLIHFLLFAFFNILIYRIIIFKNESLHWKNYIFAAYLNTISFNKEAIK